MRVSTVLLSLTGPACCPRVGGGGGTGSGQKTTKSRAEELETAEWAPSERAGTLIDALVFVFG